ncbi:MAG: Hsp20/alpha crystallin family protein [Fibromonadaceae bacterium]|jgi:HSP20 family protein|nr:Hsp20/alpha crystallin family protein [Fibromonadaceae bacterium]
MTLTNYAPVQNLNRIFDSLLDYARNDEQTKAYAPKSYLSENNGVYTLEVELPGVKKEDISVSVEANLLKIAAVRKRAEEELKYEREFHLSNEMDSANIKASNENGVLTLTLARKPEAQSKRITVG